MGARGATTLLRERIGHEATDALHTIMDESTRSTTEQIAKETEHRFEKRLTEEISGLRAEMHRGFGDLRVEMAGLRGELRGIVADARSNLRSEMGDARSDLRAEIAATRVEIIRWSFLFWAGQLGAIAALMTYAK